MTLMQLTQVIKIFIILRVFNLAFHLPSALPVLCVMASQIHILHELPQEIDRFCRQILQVWAFTKLDFPPDDQLAAFQEHLLLKCFNTSGGNAVRLTSVRYRKRVLKEIVNRLTTHEIDWDVYVCQNFQERRDISDDEQELSEGLLEELATIEVLPPEVEDITQTTPTTYTLDSLARDGSVTITILEAPNLLAAGGITGFRTWEAVSR